jgi:ribosomal protein S15P/S13E
MARARKAEARRAAQEEEMIMDDDEDQEDPVLNPQQTRLFEKVLHLHAPNYRGSTEDLTKHCAESTGDTSKKRGRKIKTGKITSLALTNR